MKAVKAVKAAVSGDAAALLVELQPRAPPRSPAHGQALQAV